VLADEVGLGKAIEAGIVLCQSWAERRRRLQHQIQEKIQKLERQQHRRRQGIYKVEDEIMDRRDQLIDQLEQRLVQRTTTETLFTIRWAVV